MSDTTCRAISRPEDGPHSLTAPAFAIRLLWCPWMRHRPFRYHRSVTTLVRADRPHDRDLESLRSRASELEAAHDQRCADVKRVEAELAAFKIRYRTDVGLLHEQLDRLELELAEAELGELQKRTD